VELPPRTSRTETIEWFMTWIVGRGIAPFMIVSSVVLAAFGNTSPVAPLLASGGTAILTLGEGIDRLKKVRQGDE
jgi:hypothetical protein